MFGKHVSDNGRVKKLCQEDPITDVQLIFTQGATFNILVINYNGK